MGGGGAGEGEAEHVRGMEAAGKEGGGSAGRRGRDGTCEWEGVRRWEERVRGKKREGHDGTGKGWGVGGRLHGAKRRG